MTRRLAVIGATGAVGSTFLGQLLRSGLLCPQDELILVGHDSADNHAHLLAARIDLLDAFDEQHINIRICADPSEVDADVVVVTAGLTISTQHPTRRDLASANIDLFHHLADSCVKRLPQAIFIVVSNPVELAVEIFSRRTNPHHVIGMGAQQDSLRFSRCLAEKLGLTRHELQVSVLGEHGAAMFPAWSTIRLLTDDRAAQVQLESLQTTCTLSDLNERVAFERERATKMLATEHIQEAYALMLQTAPDVRIFLEPFITAHVLHSTPNATSNATLQCVQAAFNVDALCLNGQVQANGYLGVAGVCGLPILLNRKGWAPAPHTYTSEELKHLQACSRSIADAIESAMGKGSSDATS